MLNLFKPGTGLGKAIQWQNSTSLPCETHWGRSCSCLLQEWPVKLASHRFATWGQDTGQHALLSLVRRASRRPRQGTEIADAPGSRAAKSWKSLA